MADDKKTYPQVTAKNWFALRKQVKKTIPPLVNPSYVAAVLEMNEGSARANVVSGLRTVGLVDKDFKPTERLGRWRDDEEYPALCKEIWEETYPDELRAIAPDADTPRDKVERWFAKKLDAGEDLARKLAVFYFLLLKADLNQETESSPKQQATKRASVPRSIRPVADHRSTRNDATIANDIQATPPVQANESIVLEARHSKRIPALHIDIQIHISPEATADQIDQIFASMAKHLKEI